MGCQGINTKDASEDEINELNENCGFWDAEAAQSTFLRHKVLGMKKHWAKQVEDAEEAGCGNPENAVSTAWHLALLFNKFADQHVFYRVATRDAVDYMISDGCEDIYQIIEDALKTYSKWGKVKNKAKADLFPAQCDKWSENGKTCEAGAVDPIDIVAFQYQVLTSGQDEETGLWDIEFLQNVFGIKQGDYPAYIEDWRLSVRLGLKAMKFPNQYLMSKIFKILDLDVPAIEIFMVNTY